MKKIFIFSIMLIMLLNTALFIFAEESTLPTADAGQITSVDATAIDKVIESVTSSTFWAALISFLLSIVGLILFIKNKFSKLFGAIGRLATNERTSADGAKNTAEIKAVMSEGYDEIKGMLESMESNYKTLMTVFTVFVENTKMNGSAKAEILEIITNIKPLTKSVPEAIAEALDHIKSVSLSQEKVETPALDAAISANAPATMSLE